MSDAKLKPCPFCGGRARVYCDDSGDYRADYTVECFSCESSGAWFKTGAAAVAAWDRRDSRLSPNEVDAIRWATSHLPPQPLTDEEHAHWILLRKMVIDE